MLDPVVSRLFEESKRRFLTSENKGKIQHKLSQSMSTAWHSRMSAQRRHGISLQGWYCHD